MSKKHFVIVGSGIVGLYAANYLLNNGQRVTLIESASEVGGLLRTIKNKHGDEFSVGVHYALSSGIKEIDKILFNRMDNRWTLFNDSLPEGNYFSGKLNCETGCIDARTMPLADYRKGVIDLLDSISKQKEIYQNMSDYLEYRYGLHFSDKIFKPLIKKFTKTATDEQTTEAQA